MTVDQSVWLRRAAQNDAAIVSKWRNEPSTSRYQPILALSDLEIRAMLATRARSALTPNTTGTIQWIIETVEGPVGWMTVDIVDRRSKLARVGYTIGEAFRGRHLGREGVRALVPIACDADGLDLERLEAVAAVENIASRKTLEGAGFEFEGILRGLLIIGAQRIDHAVYGLLKSEWEASRDG